jgi:hypothetical protein
MKDGISINDVETITDKVSGRVTYFYELSPGVTIEARSIVELVKRIQWHYEGLEEDHGQAD